jgi:ribosomal protein S1
LGNLLGLSEYLDEAYHLSIFGQAFRSKKLWEFHAHNGRIVKAEVIENLKYDVTIKIPGEKDEVLPKNNIKLLYPAEQSDYIRRLLKTDEKVKALGLEPISSPKDRFHVKNKSLFPLIKERDVVFFTLLEGEIIRGIITGFSRYDITVSLKGELPITIMRHSIYDLRNKKGRCFLKSAQEKLRDWEKSDLFVP